MTSWGRWMPRSSAQRMKRRRPSARRCVVWRRVAARGRPLQEAHQIRIQAAVLGRIALARAGSTAFGFLRRFMPAAAVTSYRYVRCLVAVGSGCHAFSRRSTHGCGEDAVFIGFSSDSAPRPPADCTPTDGPTGPRPLGVWADRPARSRTAYRTLPQRLHIDQPLTWAPLWICRAQHSPSRRHRRTAARTRRTGRDRLDARAGIPAR